MKYELLFSGQYRFIRDWDHLVQVVNETIKNNSFLLKVYRDGELKTYSLRNSSKGLVEQYTNEIISEETLTDTDPIPFFNWKPPELKPDAHGVLVG